MRVKTDNNWFRVRLVVFGLLVNLIPFFVHPIDRDIHSDIDSIRALRPDAASFQGSSPQVVSPFDSSLLAEIKKCVCQLKNLINDAVICSPIPVTEVGAISTPGTYCLANDLVGTFTINAPRVIFDMNGKQISGGIYLLSDASEVEIKNGFIDGSEVENGIDIGEDLHDIQINNVHIANANQGIRGSEGISRLSIIDTIVVECFSFNLTLTACSDVLIEHSMFNDALDSAVDGTSLMNCRNVTVINSFFNGNGINGFLVTGLMFIGCSNVLVQESNCLGNGGTGLSIFFSPKALVKDCIFNDNFRGLLGSNNSCWEIEGCHANNNENEGYFILTSTFVCIESIACENTDQGFRIFDAPDFCIDRCLAKSNSLDGFLLDGSSSGLIKECLSTGNTACGFNEAVPGGKTYGANLARANGANYCVGGVPIALGLAPYFSVAITGAAFWDNIDA